MKLTEIAFFTDRVQRMTDFYRRLLGIEPSACSDTMAVFFVEDTKIFIHYNYPLQTGELRAENHHAFLVENVDQMCERLAELGLTVEVSPRDFYWGRSAYLRDPDGHQIEITQKET